MLFPIIALGYMSCKATRLCEIAMGKVIMEKLNIGHGIQDFKLACRRVQGSVMRASVGLRRLTTKSARSAAAKTARCLEPHASK